MEAQQSVYNRSSKQTGNIEEDVSKTKMIKIQPQLIEPKFNFTVYIALRQSVEKIRTRKMEKHI